MALGTYGIVRPADVSPDDVDIILHYTASRDVTDNFLLKKLNSQSILTPYFHNSDTGGNANVELLGGLYNLKLPATEFNKKGIYTVYIRPAEIRTTISDCGVLSALPNVKGIIIDINQVPAQFRSRFTNQGLVGYRVEYLNQDGTKIPNFYRIITSSFFCEPVVTEQVNSSQKNIRYRYVDGGSDLIFCTLSPSSSPTNKPASTPFIGQPNQSIIITNTFLIQLQLIFKWPITIWILLQLHFMGTKPKVLKMVSTLYMIVLVIFTNNTTYLKLEITLMNFFMKYDKIGVII
jgi:hypothetical protein